MIRYPDCFSHNSNELQSGRPDQWEGPFFIPAKDVGIYCKPTLHLGVVLVLIYLRHATTLYLIKTLLLKYILVTDRPFF